MKVASFNVNSIRVRLPIVVGWLRKNLPDVLAVQETKAQDADFPLEAFHGIGYTCVFRGQKTYNGVAIISRHEIERVQFGLPDEPKDEPRMVTATIQGITLVNTYVPQGYLATSDRFQYKLDWFNRLLRYFHTRFKPSDPVLWMGDLNVAPLPIDVYDPAALEGHVCYHPAVREALAKVMEWGFTDLFRKHHPEPGQYTFWDYRIGNFFEKNRGWRIDHILGTVPLADRCTACYIDKEPRAADRPSDHTPIVAVIA
ncbi:MAG: exodeoxyribonuclease III [Phycisphaerales bacterium]